MLGAGNILWAAFLSPEVIGAYLLLIAALVAGGVVIVWAARRYKRPAAEELTPEEELTHYRTLLEEGELSPDEFERIRARLEPGGASVQPPAATDRSGPPDAFTPGQSPS
jgi:hypothetical protein